MVDRLPSGRIRARYVGPDGRRHSAPLTFDSLTDARGWLANRRSEIQRDAWTSPTTAAAPRITLAEFADGWLATRTGRSGVELRSRTLHEYQRLIRGPLAPLTGTPVRDVTADAVRRWHASLLKTGRTTQAARAYGLLRSIMQTAADDGLITSNPCRIRGAGSARTGKKVEPPTPVELDLIVEHMPARYRAMVLISAWGALRFGETTELRRKDLVRVEDYWIVTVSRAVTHTPAGYVVGATKSEAGVRSVALPHHISPVIDAHLAAMTSTGGDDLVFPAAQGGHLASSTLAKAYYPARAAAGRPDMPWHALRHYGATRFAQTGATLREIQARLGHSTVSAALRYQHTAGREAELVRRMAELANDT